MSSEITMIDQREVLGKSFCVYGTFDEPLFLATDVAEWIEHSKASAMLETIDEEEKLKETILTSGQNRECWFLTEDGLYEVLMQSRKPIAKVFKKEVKKILKEIRRTGSYSMQSAFLPSQAVELYAHGKIRLEFQAVEGGGCSLTVERMGAVRGVLGSAKKMNAEEFLATIVEETTDYSYYVVARELYSEYVLWCEKNRYKILNSSNFGKILRQIYPSVAGCRMWSSSVTKETAYRGLKYKNEPNTDAQPSLRR